jgi:hypothetical protein
MNADCDYNTWVVSVSIEDYFDSEDMSVDCPDYDPDNDFDGEPLELDFED